MNKKYILLLLLAVSIKHVHAQSRKADSLLTLIRSDKSDTNKVNHLNALAVELWGNLDTAIICSRNALELAKKITLDDEPGWQKGIGKSDYLLGVFNFDKGNYPDALMYNMDGLKIWEKLERKAEPKDLDEIIYLKAKAIGEIGNAYWGQGNYPAALEYEMRALKLYDALKQERGSANMLGNIVNIYSDQQNYSKALEYYFKSLKAGKKRGNKNDMSIDLRNIASVYNNMRNHAKALEYSMMALVASKEAGNYLEVANNLNSVGSAIQNQADSALQAGVPYSELKEQYEKALDYYNQSLKMDLEQANPFGQSFNLANIAGIYMVQKKYKESEDYWLRALAIDSAVGALNQIKSMHEGLSELYYQQGDYKRSLIHAKLFAKAKDSLFNEERDKEITRHELNYEFEKKHATAKAEEEKKEAVADTERKRQNIFFWLVSLVAIAVGTIAIIVFRSLRITKQQKLIMEHQKDLVDEKQKEILDSIRYAKRIQQSLLTSEKYIDKNLQRLNKKN